MSVQLTVIFILIFMVSPSLKRRSNSCFGTSFSFSISSDFLSHLKWSCRATFMSKLSERSENPTPMNADRPVRKYYNHHTLLCWSSSCQNYCYIINNNNNNNYNTCKRGSLSMIKSRKCFKSNILQYIVSKHSLIGRENQYNSCNWWTQLNNEKHTDSWHNIQKA